MFRKAEGFKAQCNNLHLVIAADFDEWRIFLQGPGVIINGGRQFSEDKAKEHAVVTAHDYLCKEEGDSPSALQEVQWIPLDKGEWLNWRP